ncbi:MAG TPA: adenylate cyclase [Actinomycetes bacterium]|nr:adenylate cyclase [Actinomycetes bacterium]
MPATKQRPRRLSDAQLGQLLALTTDADSVELKLTVPDSERRSTVTALGMDPLNAQIRQVYFFDTPDLTLDKHGVVVRARRVQQRADDSVVKLRPVVPNELPDGLRKAKNLVVEVDAMPGGYVCSASFKGTLGTTDVKEVAAGKRAIRKLYSKEQRAFFTAHAPDGVGLDELSVLGPITVLKLKFSPEGYGRRLVAELWFYPDGSRILELSTKCAPNQALQVAAETRAFLSSQGVDLLGEQQTKTKTALEYFSRNLDAAVTA